MQKQFIVRNVRMSDELDSQIRRITEREQRTISNTIQRLLESAITVYDAFGSFTKFTRGNPKDLPPEDIKKLRENNMNVYFIGTENNSQINKASDTLQDNL